MQCNSLNSSLASSLNFHFPLFSVVDDGDDDGFQPCSFFFALHNVTQCKHHAKQSIFFKLELYLRWEKRWNRHFSVDVWMSGISNSTDLMCSLCYHDKCWLHRTQPNRTKPNQPEPKPIRIERTRAYIRQNHIINVQCIEYWIVFITGRKKTASWIQ